MSDNTATAETMFAPMAVGQRADQARKAMVESEVDALLVTNLTNVRWLTGFTGSAGLLVLTKHDLVLVTDGRYAVQAPTEIAAAGSSANVEITGHEQKKIITGHVGTRFRVGLEADHVTWSRQQVFANEWFHRHESLSPTIGLIDRLRRNKDQGEIVRMAHAASIADAALATVLPMLHDRPTERTFAAELEVEMRRHGASETAFESIVASGPNGALPHHRPSPRVIEPNELVVIDCGATVEGYRSDMTRTVSVGEPSQQALDMYDAVIAAQQAGVEAVGVGVEAVAVDAACRESLATAGLAQAFTHGTGHGVGLDIHESPRIGNRSVDILEANDVITVEPGVYFPNIGGVRIEDTVVVTESGAERLTKAPKTLVI